MTNHEEGEDNLTRFINSKMAAPLVYNLRLINRGERRELKRLIVQAEVSHYDSSQAPEDPGVGEFVKINTLQYFSFW